MSATDGDIPVSYTHLDVYKRQVLIHAFQITMQVGYDMVHNKINNFAMVKK